MWSTRCGAATGRVVLVDAAEIGEGGHPAGDPPETIAEMFIFSTHNMPLNF